MADCRDGWGFLTQGERLGVVLIGDVAKEIVKAKHHQEGDRYSFQVDSTGSLFFEPVSPLAQGVLERVDFCKSVDKSDVAFSINFYADSGTQILYRWLGARESNWPPRSAAGCKTSRSKGLDIDCKIHIGE